MVFYVSKNDGLYCLAEKKSFTKDLAGNHGATRRTNSVDLIREKADTN